MLAVKINASSIVFIKGTTFHSPNRGIKLTHTAIFSRGITFVRPKQMQKFENANSSLSNTQAIPPFSMQLHLIPSNPNFLYLFNHFRNNVLLQSLSLPGISLPTKIFSFPFFSQAIFFFHILPPFLSYNSSFFLTPPPPNEKNVYSCSSSSFYSFQSLSFPTLFPKIIFLFLLNPNFLHLTKKLFYLLILVHLVFHPILCYLPSAPSPRLTRVRNHP